MQTLRAISAHLNMDLARLAASYICAPDASPIDAALYGHHELVADTEDDDLTDAVFTMACMGGHMAVISMLIERGTHDWLGGFLAACRGGHRDVMVFIYGDDPSDWPGGYLDACCGGHLSLMDELVNHTATYLQCPHISCKMGTLEVAKHMTRTHPVNTTCEQALVAAAYGGGHLDTIKYLTSQRITNPDNELYAACQGGHLAIVNTLLDRGLYAWQFAMTGACRGGHLPVVQRLLERAGPGIYVPFAASYACKAGHLEVVKFLLPLIKDPLHASLMQSACSGGNVDIIDLLTSYGNTSWEAGMTGASEGGHINIVKLMASRGATNWDNCLVCAADNGHLRVVQYAIAMGATNTEAAMEVANESGATRVVQYLARIA
jgi:hypothetical protein